VATDPQRRALVAALRDRHDGELRRVVARRATDDRAIVARACREAWAQLVDAHGVDLCPPRWSALAWVTSYAMHRACALADEADRADVARHVAALIDVWHSDSLVPAPFLGHCRPVVVKACKPRFGA
jgi:hypothetical protein